MKLIRRLWKDEKGQGLIEYALIIAIISIVIILFGDEIAAAIQTLFTKIKDALNNRSDDIPT